jgi:hypothetical protein
LAKERKANLKNPITKMTRKNVTTEVKVVKINDIKNNPNNPRVIKDDKYKKLVKSLIEFPEMLNIRPIVVNETMIVLGGNMRLKACKEAGMEEVPIIIAKDLTEEKQREFIVKDNIGYGEWDWDLLANEWDMEKLDDWGLDVITKQNWEALDYIDEELPAPEMRKDNVITITIPDEILGQIKEIEQLVKDTLSETYSGCEVK